MKRIMSNKKGSLINLLISFTLVKKYFLILFTVRLSPKNSIFLMKTDDQFQDIGVQNLIYTPIVLPLTLKKRLLTKHFVSPFSN